MLVCLSVTPWRWWVRYYACLSVCYSMALVGVVYICLSVPPGHWWVWYTCLSVPLGRWWVWYILSVCLSLQGTGGCDIYLSVCLSPQDAGGCGIYLSVCLSPGRWWVVGSAWTGRDTNNTSNSGPAANLTPDSQSWVLDLARKQRMNTDIRKKVFSVLMTSEVSFVFLYSETCIKRPR